MKSKTNRQLRVFTGQELEALRDHAEGDRLVFLLLTRTGLRTIDAIELNWGGVDLAGMKIEHVGKKNCLRTILPIHAELLAELRMEHQRRNRRQNEPVLQHANGKPFTREFLRRRIRALGKRSGVHHVNPRRFRQSFAFRNEPPSAVFPRGPGSHVAPKTGGGKVRKSQTWKG
jgi:integrase